MSQSQPFPASFGRSLAQRLDRLGGTLADLRERMHDAIAHAVGVAAADAVRAVTRALLGTGAAPPPTPSHSWSPAPRSALWDEPEDLPSEDRFAPLDEEDEDPEDIPRPASAQPSPARNALALGCEGAAWWLRRGLGNAYVLGTLAMGLLCTAVAYLAGDRLAGSLLSLAALTDTLRSGTALFTSILTS